jgi:hypothetical protein
VGAGGSSGCWLGPVGAGGRRWVPAGAGGCCLGLVGAGGCRWVLAGASGCWRVQVGAGGCWLGLVGAGGCWLGLVGAGGCRWQEGRRQGPCVCCSCCLALRAFLPQLRPCPRRPVAGIVINHRCADEQEETGTWSQYRWMLRVLGAAWAWT